MSRLRLRAFTLFELLVVIGIIAGLISILLPAVKKVATTRVSFDLAPNIEGNSNFVTPSDESAPALPGSHGDYTDFDWQVTTEDVDQEPTESLDFGPGIGESRVLPEVGVGADEQFTGHARFENVNGDLVITSSSSRGFLGFDLIDSVGANDGGPFKLFNEDAFSTSGAITIPAAQVAGKSIEDVIPQIVPLFFQSVPETDVTLLRSDTDEPVANLISVSATQQVAAVPEPTSIAIWIALGVLAMLSCLRLRKR